MRKASAKSSDLSFSCIWHFTLVLSGQHFSTTLKSKTLFFMSFTSLDGKWIPTHLRQNVWPQDMVTGSHIRKRHSGHFRRSMVDMLCHQSQTAAGRIVVSSKHCGRGFFPLRWYCVEHLTYTMATELYSKSWYHISANRTDTQYSRTRTVSVVSCMLTWDNTCPLYYSPRRKN